MSCLSPNVKQPLPIPSYKCFSMMNVCSVIVLITVYIKKNLKFLQKNFSQIHNALYEKQKQKQKLRLNQKQLDANSLAKKNQGALLVHCF